MLILRASLALQAQKKNAACVGQRFFCMRLMRSFQPLSFAVCLSDLYDRLGER